MKESIYIYMHLYIPAYLNMRGAGRNDPTLRTPQAQLGGVGGLEPDVRSYVRHPKV